MAKQYRYIGSGQGVPGLPHELTDAQAKAMGDTAYPDPGDKKGAKRLTHYGLLMAAVAAGNYEEVKSASSHRPPMGGSKEG